MSWRAGATSITPAQLLDLIDRGAAPRVIDVRTRAEFAAGHVPGAVNLPAAGAWSRAGVRATAAGEPIVVYCGHGPRAWFASLGLRCRGVRQIAFLRGHWAAWRRAGLRMERE